MIIELKKFGTTLVSRQAGRESWAAFQPRLYSVDPAEHIEIDFEGVLTLSPSWADEFLTPLKKNFVNRVVLRKTKNPSVHATLEILAIE
jgi:hypothetical protein